MKHSFLSILLLNTISLPSLAAQWVVNKETNPVENITSYYALSPTSNPITPLKFPYSDAKSWVGVGCDTKKNVWAYIGYTKSNFTGGSWSNSSKIHYNIKFRFDDQIKNYSLRESGDNLFITQNENDFVENLKKANYLTTGIHWYKQGAVYFKYSMSGSSKAIKSIMDNCGIKKAENLNCSDLSSSYTKFDIDMLFYQKKEISLEKYQELKSCINE